MKKRFAVLVSALALCTLGGPVSAETTPTPPPAATQAAKPTKTKVARTMRVSGEVGSVSQDAKTLTVKRMVRHKAQELTFAVDAGAVSSLADLKPGDKVRVTYTDADGHPTATAIARTGHVASK